MSQQPYPDPAFVAPPAPTFSTSFNTTCGLSSRRSRPSSRCKNRPIKNWRCTITDEGLEDVSNQLGQPSDAVGEVKAQVEGPISDLDLSTMDDGLQDALLKSWDILEGFEAGMELPVVHVDENEERTGAHAKATAKEVAHQIQTQQNTHETAKEGDSQTNVVNDQEASFPGPSDESSQVLESDSAVEAIEEAKKGKKTRKKKTPVKSTKEKTTAKKRGKKKVADSPGNGERELTKREILDSEAWDPDPNWYFLQVKPGCEQSCAISIRNMAKSLEKLEVHEVLVPATTILSLTKGGQSKKKEERIFPGYILVRMVMNYQNYNDLQKVPNVQYFMGDPNRDKGPDEPFRSPIPVSDAEMKVVYEKVSAADNQDPEEKTMLRPGDSVEVLWGEFQGSKGFVNEVKPLRNIVTVRLLMFGRETPVEFNMDQVAAISDITDISQPEDDLEAYSDENNETNVNGRGVAMDKSNQKAQTHVSEKGPNADVASAADDLAALLADIPGGSDDDFDDFFSITEDSAEFGRPRGSIAKGSRAKPRRGTGWIDTNGFLDFDDSKAAGRNRANEWLDEKHEDNGFLDDKPGMEDTSPQSDKVGEPFAFLDEDIDAAQKESKGITRNELRPSPECVEEGFQDVNFEKSQSSSDAFIQSDDDLASFLGSSVDESIWDTAKNFLSVSEPQGSSVESSRSGARMSDSQSVNFGEDVKREVESDEFAFLDKFDEAEEIPDNILEFDLSDTEGKSTDES